MLCFFLSLELKFLCPKGLDSKVDFVHSWDWMCKVKGCTVALSVFLHTCKMHNLSVCLSVCFCMSFSIHTHIHTYIYIYTYALDMHVHGCDVLCTYRQYAHIQTQTQMRQIVPISIHSALIFYFVLCLLSILSSTLFSIYLYIFFYTILYSLLLDPSFLQVPQRPSSGLREVSNAGWGSQGAMARWKGWVLGTRPSAVSPKHWVWQMLCW